MDGSELVYIWFTGRQTSSNLVDMTATFHLNQVKEQLYAHLLTDNSGN